MPPVRQTVPRTPRKPASRRGATIARWAQRLAKAGMALGAVAVVGLAWRTGRLQAAADWTGGKLLQLSLVGGFRVDDIEVIGRQQTERQTLLAAIGLKRGDPILAFDPDAARQRIESLPWVSNAAVERRLPGAIFVTIVERRPIAIWQHNERLSLIDADGANLGPVDIDKAPPLPLVVGGDAPAHTGELLDQLARHADIAARVKASSWIGSRRWDLKLDNGVEIKLPETGVEEALQKLSAAEAGSKLFERDVASIDLRLPGKMIIRLAHEPAPIKAVKAEQGI